MNARPAYMNEPWFALLLAQVSRPGVVRARIARQLGITAGALSQLLNATGLYGNGTAPDGQPSDPHLWPLPLPAFDGRSRWARTGRDYRRAMPHLCPSPRAQQPPRNEALAGLQRLPPQSRMYAAARHPPTGMKRHEKTAKTPWP